jgi:GT2 family glycosyltransferase
MTLSTIPLQPSVVWALLVTYNGKQWIRRCLESLIQNGISNIVIVDNASVDETPKIVSKEFPDAILIENSTNLGFGKANNLGIQKALDNGATHVLLVNQDIVFQQATVNLLLSVMEKDSGFGLVSAFQLTYEGNSIDAAFRTYMPPSFTDDLYFSRKKQLYETDYMPAAAVLMSREALLSVGGFDPLFFLYGEDDDLCSRLRKAGWKIGVVPAATVQHWHSFLHKKRDMKWRRNFTFTRGIKWLKNNPHSLFIAYLTLARTWFADVDPLEICARIPAFLKCIAKAATVHAHRARRPYSFSDPSHCNELPFASTLYPQKELR